VASALATAAGKVTLFQRFMLVSLVILVVGAYVIGSFTAGEIKTRVIARTSAITALYVDSFVSPHLQELETGGTLSAEHFGELDGLLSTTPLGKKIVAFKIWSTGGEVLYANNNLRLIGQQFSIEGDLARALDGEVAAEISNLDSDENQFERPQYDHLLEVYVPVHAKDSGEIIGASEFYQDPAELESEVNSSQRKGWLIVGGATGAMYLLLVGMVRGANTTISRQHRRLEQLAGQNAALAERVRRAAAQKSETDERLLMRIAQDLHDGPAQDVSLALLRLEAVGAPDDEPGRPASVQEDIQLMRAALSGAIKDIREIAAGLRLPEMEGLSLTEVVERAVQEHKEKTGNRVTVSVASGLPAAGLPAKIAVYRVVQEALNNSYQHAGVDEEEVDLRVSHGSLRLEVRDRGVGLEGSAGPRGEAKGRAPLGLRGMRERVEMLGGGLEVASEPGSGTTVRAVIPLTREEESRG
jgi:signal transduction histidine kinase